MPWARPEHPDCVSSRAAVAPLPEAVHARARFTTRSNTPLALSGRMSPRNDLEADRLTYQRGTSGHRFTLRQQAADAVVTGGAFVVLTRRTTRQRADGTDHAVKIIFHVWRRSRATS